jgi:putative ABC transport system permease protein
VDPGHNVDRILTFRIAVPAQRYPDDAAVRGVYDELLAGLRALPGVESAAAISRFMLGRLPGSAQISLDDESARGDAEQALPIPYDFVTPGFFATMSIPLRQGRPFDASDRPGAPPTAIVNQTFASRFFPGRDPIGRRWTFGNRSTPDSLWFTIVGVVGDTRRTGLDRPERPLIYLAGTPPGMMVAIRAAGAADPMALAPLARRVLASVDPDIPLTELRSVAQILGETVAQRRFLTLLLAAFGGLALAIAAVGVYGVMAYLVGQRTREIGIRLALGARSRDVLRQVLANGMVPVTAGLAVGLVAALLLARALGRFLFDVSATDPATFAGVLLLLAGIAALACWLPARRAARIHPVDALRGE